MKRYHIWVIGLIIINELFFWNIFRNATYTDTVMVLLAVGILLDITLVIIILKQRNKNKLERELEEITIQYEGEKHYYQELEKSREAKAKLRHDYNNHITAMLGLIRMGKISEAKAMIDEIQTRIDGV